MSDVAAPDGNPATHFEIVTRNGKNKLYKCKYCDKEFSGTGTRCYVHLTGDGTGVARCSSVPEDVVRACKAAKAERDAESSRKRKADEDAEAASSNLLAPPPAQQEALLRPELHQGRRLCGVVGVWAVGLWQQVGRAVYDHGDRFYNFSGLRAFKSKFGPHWEARYMVVQGGINPMLALADITVLISGGLWGVVGN